MIAYRAPDGDVPITESHPKITSSGGAFDLSALTDGDLMKAQALNAPEKEDAWIQFEFAAPRTVRGLTIALRPRVEAGQSLESSDEGRQFTKVSDLPARTNAQQRTISFAPVTARFFRVRFERRPAPATQLPYQVTELVLHSDARVNRFEEKAAFALAPTLYSMATPSNPSGAIRKTDVVDLTIKMRPDGSLDWTPPPGRWVVLRMGYSLLGIMNHPASQEATGLEVDKLNRDYVKAYLDKYLDQYKDATGGLMGQRGLRYVITDSYEAGPQNWTDKLPDEFSKRRGYDMHPWMPALAGRVVESAEATDRFLWDFRKTLADLMAEYHYDQIGETLHARGMGRYSESHESGRALIADGMEVKRKADIPMSAMWTQRPGVNEELYGYNADIRESASVAHIYGQNLVAAESLTSTNLAAWAWSPETLKPTADKELAMGLNRFVIHTSVHQPVSDKIPGLGLGPYGQWFTRHETWAESAKPWVTYLARSCYLLQQGKFVADIAYYYGEDNNVTSLFSAKSPDVPAGYNFDFVNADALIHELSAKDGRIVTKTGMSYRVLALDPNSQHMALAVLRKIRDLVNAGATVAGPKPVESPSLSDDQAEFHRIADELWSGKIKADLAASLGAAPDFEAPANLLFVHRKLIDGDIYWVNNRSNRALAVDAAFRVTGKAPEIWHADTGATEAAAYAISGDRTSVPLHLDPWDAVFVVFRRPAAASSRTIWRPVETSVATIDGAWSVAFQADRGAPEKMSLDKLSSWSDSDDGGVKYFSGTAVYSKTIDAPGDWFQPSARLWLDLGDVKNLAEISVNGKPLGIVWKTPFRVDVTDAFKPGPNTLSIKVTNLWVNRLIGDQQPDVKKKYTYTTQAFYKADSPLLPSGLLGPVQIVRAK